MAEDRTDLVASILLAQACGLRTVVTAVWVDAENPPEQLARGQLTVSFVSRVFPPDSTPE